VTRGICGRGAEGGAVGREMGMEMVMGKEGVLRGFGNVG